MDDSILDISDDELLVKETQLPSTSPTSFFCRLVNRLSINSQQGPGSETANPSENITNKSAFELPSL